MEKTGDYELCFNNYFSVMEEKKVVLIKLSSEYDNVEAIDDFDDADNFNGFDYNDGDKILCTADNDDTN